MSNKSTQTIHETGPFTQELCIGICDMEGRESPYMRTKVNHNGQIIWFPNIPFYVQHSVLCDRNHPIGVFEAPSMPGEMDVGFFINDDRAAEAAAESEVGQAALDQYNALKLMLYSRFRDRLWDLAYALIGAKLEKSTVDLWQLASDISLGAELIHRGKSVLENEYANLQQAAHSTNLHNAHILATCKALKESGSFGLLIDAFQQRCEAYVKESHTSLPNTAPEEWGAPAGDFVCRAVYSAVGEDGSEVNISFYAGAKQNNEGHSSLDFTYGWEGIVKRTEMEEKDDGKVVSIVHNIGNVADAFVYSQAFGLKKPLPRVQQILNVSDVNDTMASIVDQAEAFVKDTMKDKKPLPNIIANATVYRCS